MINWTVVGRLASCDGRRTVYHTDHPLIQHAAHEAARLASQSLTTNS